MKSHRAIFLIVFLGTLLRLISLNQSFWLDEAAQATISSHNLFSVNWGADFQPPLFYILTHFWQSFGIKEEWFLRLPSVFFGVVTVYLTYYFFKRLFNEKVGLVASLLLATAPYHIYYSQEYRMYSFFAFLALLSWIFLWEKKWIWYGITILAAVFTHYFAFLLLASQFIFIFIARRGEWRKYVMIILLSLTPFLLWLPVLTKQLQTASNLISAWPRWREISSVAFLKFPFLILAKFTVGVASPENKIVYGFFILFMATIVLLTVFRLLQSQLQPSRLESASQQSEIGLLMCFSLIPLITSWLSGLFIAVNTPHRLMFVLPAFYGMITVGLSKLMSSKNVNAGLLVLLICMNIFFSFSYLFSPKHHREDWQNAVDFTDSKIRHNGIALTEYIGAWAPLEWYSQNPEKYIGASNSMIITTDSIDQQLSHTILNTKYLPAGRQAIILCTYLFQLSDPNRLVEKYLDSKGYTLTEEKDFRGVGIIRVFSLSPASLP